MPERGTLDNSKARDLLGFNPQFPLEKGFTQYVSSIWVLKKNFQMTKFKFKNLKNLC